MTPLLKAALYLGAVLLLGAGVFRHVGPKLAPAMARTLRRGTLVGTILLLGASLADVTWTVTQLLGRWDAAFVWEYTLYTRHGRLALVRIALVTTLLVLSLRPRAMRPWLFSLTSLGILVTLSFLSHAAVMHGAPAFLADVLHFTAATLWGGAVLYAALSPAWEHEPASAELMALMARVSSLGLGCVLLLAATGVYASLLHLSHSAKLTTTPYGLALMLKLALVGTVLAVAALNRWWLLPALKRGKTRRLGQLLKLEAILLLTVFAATGILTTRPLPHT